MGRGTVISMVMMLSVASAAVQVEPSMAKAPISRLERCDRLDRQLATILNDKRADRHESAARALRTKAHHFCATRREAQGIRYYADALKMLGARPADGRKRPNRFKHTKETTK